VDPVDAHAELSDPAAAPERLVEVMNAVIPGVRVELVIDLTDPPTLPRAVLGELEASGENADDAVRALASAVAGDIHAQAVAVAVARATEPLKEG
jgi:hypothetical protein